MKLLPTLLQSMIPSCYLNKLTFNNFISSSLNTPTLNTKTNTNINSEEETFFLQLTRHLGTGPPTSDGTHPPAIETNNEDCKVTDYWCSSPEFSRQKFCLKDSYYTNSSDSTIQVLCTCKCDSSCCVTGETPCDYKQPGDDQCAKFCEADCDLTGAYLVLFGILLLCCCCCVKGCMMCNRSRGPAAMLKRAEGAQMVEMQRVNNGGGEGGVYVQKLPVAQMPVQQVYAQPTYGLSMGNNPTNQNQNQYGQQQQQGQYAQATYPGQGYGQQSQSNQWQYAMSASGQPVEMDAPRFGASQDGMAPVRY